MSEKCGHDSYWKGRYGTCMCCRAEKAESSLTAAQEELAIYKDNMTNVCAERDKWKAENESNVWLCRNRLEQIEKLKVELAKAEATKKERNELWSQVADLKTEMIAPPQFETINNLSRQVSDLEVERDELKAELEEMKDTSKHGRFTYLQEQYEYAIKECNRYKALCEKMAEALIRIANNEECPTHQDKCSGHASDIANLALQSYEAEKK